MNYKQHIIGGLLISFIYIFSTFKIFNWNINTLMIALPIIIYYSIFADIDHRMSKITNFMLITSAFLITLGYLSSVMKYEYLTLLPNTLILIGIILLILTLFSSSNMIKHRGILHTLRFTLLSPLILIFVIKLNKENIHIYILAFISYWSHLFLDKIPFKL